MVDLVSDTWTLFIDYLKTKLVDPLGRGNDQPWIYSSFPGPSYELIKPCIVVTQFSLAPMDAPVGLGNTKRYYSIGLELFIFTNSDRVQIDSSFYSGAELREYYTNEIVKLLTDSLKDTCQAVSATDMHLSSVSTLPYFEDLDEWRKQVTILIETYKQ